MVEQITIQTALLVLQSVSLTIGVIYHIMILRNNQRTQRMTLETRQAGLLMQIYNRWSAHDFQDAWQLWNSFDYDSLEQGIEVFKMARAEKAKGILSAFFEGIGVLVKEELVDIRLVADLLASPIMTFWEKIAPIIGELRNYNESPRELVETENLYNVLKKYLDENPEFLKTE